MKRNALVKIILWSTALLVLLGIFFALLYVPGMNFQKKENPAEETWIPVPLTTMPQNQSDCNAVTTEVINVCAKPSDGSDVVGMLERGSSLLITGQESSEGNLWGYVVYPTTGWVSMEYVELLEPVDAEITAIETASAPEPETTDYGFSLDAAGIRNIAIEWAAGSIVIQAKDIPEIRISEEGEKQSEKPMVWKIQDDKLIIQFAKDLKFSITTGMNLDDFSKDLLIEVPLDWQCNELEVAAASASLDIKNLAIRDMEFDGASGTCVFDNCTVEKLDLDTASGNVRFTGSLQQLDCDAVSADIVLELTNVPGRLDMDTVSGDLEVTLPADAGFTVSMDTLSSVFESDFETTMRNGSYIAGNGRCRIDVDAMSGDVIIRKSAN
jgi:hypothetical protein